MSEALQDFYLLNAEQWYQTAIQEMEARVKPIADLYERWKRTGDPTIFDPRCLSSHCQHRLCREQRIWNGVAERVLKPAVRYYAWSLRRLIVEQPEHVWEALGKHMDVEAMGQRFGWQISTGFLESRHMADEACKRALQEAVRLSPGEAINKLADGRLIAEVMDAEDLRSAEQVEEAIQNLAVRAGY